MTGFAGVIRVMGADVVDCHPWSGRLGMYEEEGGVVTEGGCLGVECGGLVGEGEGTGVGMMYVLRYFTYDGLHTVLTHTQHSLNTYTAQS